MRSKHWRLAQADYAQRLGFYTRLNLVEVRDFGPRAAGYGGDAKGRGFAAERPAAPTASSCCRRKGNC
ncbi:MAG: hypothetical protein IPJ94_21185 [Chloroflexi bacterium]|nr:hypothetical protein [Chloroflexota bacterium]